MLNEEDINVNRGVKVIIGYVVIETRGLFDTRELILESGDVPSRRLDCDSGYSSCNISIFDIFPIPLDEFKKYKYYVFSTVPEHGFRYIRGHTLDDISRELKLWLKMRIRGDLSCGDDILLKSAWGIKYILQWYNTPNRSRKEDNILMIIDSHMLFA